MSSYHVYLFRIKEISEQQRDQIIQQIYEKGVAVNVHFIPLPMMTYYKNNGYSMDDYPVSYDNFARVISLPVYYDLTDDQVNEVAATVVKSVEELL